MGKEKQYTVYAGTDREFTGNLKDVAKHFNVNYQTVFYRLDKMSLEEALDCEIKSYEVYTAFAGTDKEFTGSMNSICKHFKVNNSSVSFLMNKGLSLEEAIEYKKNNAYTVYKNEENEFSGTLPKIAEHFNVPCNTLRRRLNKGMTLEEAIECDNSCAYTVYAGTENEFSGNLKEIAAHFNVRYAMIKDRVSKSRMTPEEAMETPVRMKDAYEWKNDENSLRDICVLENKDFVEVYNKLRYGHTLKWSIESTDEPYLKE